MLYSYDEGTTVDLIEAASRWMSNNLNTTREVGTSGYEFDSPGYTGGQAPTVYPPVNPTPITPYESGHESNPITPPTSGSNLVVKSPVKIATPQYVNFNEATINPITTNEILNLYFEEINGHALLLLNNTNFVNTPSINYQPIVNMWEITKRYDPKKILGLQDTSDTYFGNFSIKLENKIPKVPSTESTNGKNVYLATNQDLLLTQVVVGYNRSARLVIETVNMEKDERVEIEILSDGTIDTDLIEEYGSW